MERWGTFLFKYRDAVFPAVILATIIATRPRFPGGSRAADLWLDLLGILVAAAGQLLRITVIGYRYIVRGGKNRQVHAEDLVTDGIFALARNPLYVGNILVLFVCSRSGHIQLLRKNDGPLASFRDGYQSIFSCRNWFSSKSYGITKTDGGRTVCTCTPNFSVRNQVSEDLAALCIRTGI